MKPIKSLCSALLLLAAITLAAPASAGTTSQYFNPKSPLRYNVCSYTFSTTATITDAIVCVLPPGGAILKDVVLAQNAAGDGTSWAVTAKRGTAALLSTGGGFTSAAGTLKTTNAAASPMGALTNPTGGTQPVVQGDVHASGTVTIADALAAGEIVTIDGVAFTTVASGATGRQWNLGADEDGDAVNLAAAINAYGGKTVATAALHVVTIKSRLPGTVGNAITFAKTGAHLTITGSGTLINGWNALGTGGEVVLITVTATGAYTSAFTGAAHFYFEPRN